MSAIEVITQAQLDKALANLEPGDWIVCLGGTRYAPLKVGGSSRVVAWGSSRVEAWGSSHVVARESSHVVARGSSHVEAWGSSHVEAWGSSHVEAWGSSHVVAWGSSHVEARESSHVEARESSHVEARESSHVVARESSHVVAWGSSHVVAWGSSHVEARGSSHVEARGSSHVEARESSHVEARESSHVEARESSHVEASPYVTVTKQIAHRGKIAGGVVIEIPKVKTAQEWIDFQGLVVKRGVVTLYKAVDDEFESGYGFSYTPGTRPKCDDWSTQRACGGGLHLTAHPLISRSYMESATRYVACPVKVAEIVVIDNEKVKVPRIAGAIYEVTADRERVGVDDVAA